MNREEFIHIQHDMDLPCGIIPHNDPNYWENLRDVEENYVDWEDDGCPGLETAWIDELDKLTEEDIELPF